MGVLWFRHPPGSDVCEGGPYRAERISSRRRAAMPRLGGLMRENPVKRKLAGGGVALGTMAFEFNSTGLARLTAGAGAAFVIFDQEHTGWSVETIRMLVATSGAADLVPMVRVTTHQYHLIAPPLDVGVRGVMVPL